MGQRNDSFMIYVCDNCGAVMELDGVIGGPLGGPVNWKTVQPQTTTDGDWFCGYKCLAEWSSNMAAKQDARSKARQAKAIETTEKEGDKK